MLELLDINTYYGLSHVLQGISLKVARDEIIGIVGRNGAGKTTTLLSIVGFLQPMSGSISFLGKDILALPVYKIVQTGISLVPQGRHIFPSLTVRENLEIGAYAYNVRKEGYWNVERIHSLFPILKARARNKGRQLSGGEAQMLAIGRALMTNPKMLLMDEPTEGLAPIMVRTVTETLKEFKNSKLPVLLVEQNLHVVLDSADRVYVLNKGRIVHESTPENLWSNEKVKSQYLGI